MKRNTNEQRRLMHRGVTSISVFTAILLLFIGGLLVTVIQLLSR